MESPRDDNEAIAAFYKAASHRTRRHILLVMEEEGGQPLAPADYERRVRSGDEKKLSLVSYHFKVLRDVGLIELAGSERTHGSVKNLFRLSPVFTPDLRDKLALDKIVEILGGDVGDRLEEVVREIVDILLATGRPVS